jgi:hypothetical protein
MDKESATTIILNPLASEFKGEVMGCQGKIQRNSLVLILASSPPFPGQDQVKAPVSHEYVVRAITLAVTVQDSRGRFVALVLGEPDALIS